MVLGLVKGMGSSGHAQFIIISREGTEYIDEKGVLKVWEERDSMQYSFGKQ